MAKWISQTITIEKLQKIARWTGSKNLTSKKLNKKSKILLIKKNWNLLRVKDLLYVLFANSKKTCQSRIYKWSCKFNRVVIRRLYSKHVCICKQWLFLLLTKVEIVYRSMLFFQQNLSFWIIWDLSYIIQSRKFLIPHKWSHRYPFTRNQKLNVTK